MAGQRTISMVRLLQILLMCASLHDSHGLLLVPAKRGTCKVKIAEASFNMFRSSRRIKHCHSLTSSEQQTECEEMEEVDLCEIPLIFGAVTIANSDIWGIDPLQQGQRFPYRSTHSVTENMMIRKDCDAIGGNYEGEPTPDAAVYCELYWKKLNGNDRNAIDTLILAGDGSCKVKIRTLTISMKQQHCRQAGGSYRWYGTPIPTAIVNCLMDVCTSPILDCEPSDQRLPLQTCTNTPSDKATKSCSFDLRVGLDYTQRRERTTYAHLSKELRAQIAMLFTASPPLPAVTGFDWPNAMSSLTSSEISTTKLQVDLEPSQSFAIRQMVGTCGYYYIYTATVSIKP